jgi:hypothetical protein
MVEAAALSQPHLVGPLDEHPDQAAVELLQALPLQSIQTPLGHSPRHLLDTATDIQVHPSCLQGHDSCWTKMQLKLEVPAQHA